MAVYYDNTSLKAKHERKRSLEISIHAPLAGSDKTKRPHV